MKALVYMQVVKQVGIPKLPPWLSQLKQEVADLNLLELDNFSRPELSRLVPRFLDEAQRVALVLNFEENAPALGSLLPILQHSGQHPARACYVCGALPGPAATQLRALGLKVEEFSVARLVAFYNH